MAARLLAGKPSTSCLPCSRIKTIYMLIVFAFEMFTTQMVLLEGFFHHSVRPCTGDPQIQDEIGRKTSTGSAQYLLCLDPWPCSVCVCHCVCTGVFLVSVSFKYVCIYNNVDMDIHVAIINNDKGSSHVEGQVAT